MHVGIICVKIILAYISVAGRRTMSRKPTVMS